MEKHITSEVLRIIIINSDLSSKGGISSVIQTMYRTNLSLGCPVEMTLLKTSHYKDKHLLSEICLLFSSLVKFFYILAFKKVDIVHIHSSAYLSFYRKSIFLFVCKLFRKKTIIHLHSSKFREFFITSNRLQRAYIRFVFNHTDLVVTLCREWETKLRSHYPLAKTQTIHNPINIQDYKYNRKPRIGKGNFRILYLAFLIPTKGVKDIITIAKRLKESHEYKIEIIIGGKGELQKTLIDSINQHRLEKVIDFKGWVDGDIKQELLVNSDVFLLPSYNEGMPISILEAMCNGLPIVASRIDAVPELVEDGINGYLKSPGDIEGFYSVLTQLASDRNLVSKMGKESLRKVSEFDASIILEKWIDTYHQLTT
jgi:glycosyltransferase involved in cell wall biosynthesis